VPDCSATRAARRPSLSTTHNEECELHPYREKYIDCEEDMFENWNESGYHDD
jgi:hypothetical protein